MQLLGENMLYKPENISSKDLFKLDSIVVFTSSNELSGALSHNSSITERYSSGTKTSNLLFNKYNIFLIE